MQRPSAFLVTLVGERQDISLWGEEINREMLELARTADLVIVNKEPFIQRIRRIDSKTFLSSGILQRIKDIISENPSHALLFSRDFSPAQQKNINMYFIDHGIRIITKTDLIYEIFLKRASTAPSKIQIELANLKYMRTRLVGSYEGYDRIRGGVGIKGPGETKLEIDKRSISKRIHRLTQELKRFEAHSRLLAAGRADIPTVSLVGYTNAGKSSLLNVLTGGNQLAENLLFSTVDVKSRKMAVGGGRSIVISDTIGFIRELPAHLVESFKTTLLEISFSQLIVIVADYSSPFHEEHLEVVRKILGELGCSDIPRIIAYNKIDRIPDLASPPPEEDGFYVSVKDRIGVEQLRKSIAGFFGYDG